MKNINQTITALVDDLQPVGRPTNILQVGALFFLIASTLTIVAMSMWAPFRANFLDQLLSSPQFSVEIVLGALLCASLALFAFKLSVPDMRNGWWNSKTTLVLGLLWLALLAYAFVSPALQSSMSGKREICYVEALFYSIPITLVGILIMRKGFVLDRFKAGLVIGMAGGVIPAVLMQVACMYEPNHAVSHHLTPILASCLVGVIGSYLMVSGNS